MLNPFNTKYPIRPEFFANRKNELDMFRRDLKRTLDSKLPENIVILGDWGVGKTSLAYKFLDIAEDTEGAKILTSGIEVPKTVRSIDNFCYLLLYKLNQDITLAGNISAKLREALLSWRTKQLGLGPFTIERAGKETPMIPLSQLHSHLVELWHDHLAKDGVDAVLIVIDDIHHLVGAVQGGILDIRSIFQELPRYGCNYQLIATGHKELFGSIRELAEPMSRFFNTYEVVDFNRDETEELIRTPIERVAGLDVQVTDEVIYSIYEQTKGNPYFVTFFMQILVECREKGVIDMSFFESKKGMIAKHLESEKFQRDWKIASDYEKQVIKKLANVEDEIVQFKNIHVKKDKVKVAKALDRLIEKNLLVKVERGKYKLYHPLFKEYLREVHERG